MQSFEVLVGQKKGTALPRLAAASADFSKVDATVTPLGVLFPLAKHFWQKKLLGHVASTFTSWY